MGSRASIPQSKRAVTMTMWQTFECQECGDVEDIDTEEMTSVTIYPCKRCGASLELVDAELTGSNK